jgi:hypothetical protein
MSSLDLHLARGELALRVQDWKGHNLDSFGPLLLHDTLRVSNSGISQRTGLPREACEVGAIDST